MVIDDTAGPPRLSANTPLAEVEVSVTAWPPAGAGAGLPNPSSSVTVSGPTAACADAGPVTVGEVITRIVAFPAAVSSVTVTDEVSRVTPCGSDRLTQKLRCGCPP